MTKQEKIKEAYGEYWEQLPDGAKEQALSNNGWFDFDSKHFPVDLKERFDTESSLIRHKTLSGIENNHGWIKLESEADLPKYKGKYWVIQNLVGEIEFTKRVYPNSKFSDEVNANWWMKFVTHYQPIVKPEPPIY